MSAWANSLNIKTSTVPVYPIKSMVTMKKPTFPFILKPVSYTHLTLPTIA